MCVDCLRGHNHAKIASFVSFERLVAVATANNPQTFTMSVGK